jgi:hypothetical protein
MNPLMQNKSEDGMVIQIVSQRNPIGGNGFSHRLKMFKGGLHSYHSCSYDPPRVVIFGEDQIMFFSCLRKPEVVGGIMLEEGPRSGCLKTGIDLPFFFRERMVVSIPQGIEAKAIALKGPMKSLLSFFGQKGKIEFSSEGLCLLTNVLEFLIKPLKDIGAPHMESTVRSLPQMKRLLSVL